MKDKYHSANVIIKETQNQGALLLGDCNSAIDQHYLKPYKIKTIISIGKETFAIKQKIPEDIYVHQFDVLDNKNQKIAEMFDEIYEIIEKGRAIGGVLVHCFSGISRSASFALAYIMRKNFINYDDAKSLVKKNRPCIYPNDGFIRQLQSYWKILLKRNQKSKFVQTKQPYVSQIQNQSQQIQVNENPSNKSKLRKGYKGAVKMALLQNRQKRQTTKKQNLSIIDLEQNQMQSKIIEQIEQKQQKNSTQPSLITKKEVQN